RRLIAPSQVRALAATANRTTAVNIETTTPAVIHAQSIRRATIATATKAGAFYPAGPECDRSQCVNGSMMTAARSTRDCTGNIAGTRGGVSRVFRSCMGYLVPD